MQVLSLLNFKLDSPSEMAKKPLRKKVSTAEYFSSVFFIVPSIGNCEVGVSLNPAYFPEKLHLFLKAFHSAYEGLCGQLGAAKSRLASMQESMRQITSDCAVSRESLAAKSLALIVRG